jgi:CrcB protein
VGVALAVGFLGAFTTFSTFGFETQTFLRTGRPQLALAYVALSVVLGVAAAAAGYGIGRVIR